MIPTEEMIDAGLDASPTFRKVWEETSKPTGVKISLDSYEVTAIFNAMLKASGMRLLPKPTLTCAQEIAFEAVKQFISDEGYAPTMGELADILGYRSNNGASDMLKALQRKGYISRQPTKSRSIRIL